MSSPLKSQGWCTGAGRPWQPQENTSYPGSCSDKHTQSAPEPPGWALRWARGSGACVALGAPGEDCRVRGSSSVGGPGLVSCCTQACSGQQWELVPELCGSWELELLRARPLCRGPGRAGPGHPAGLAAPAHPHLPPEPTGPAQAARTAEKDFPPTSVRKLQQSLSAG